MPAVHPQDGEPIERGKIYVAPPDHHLIVEPGHIHLGMGPKEQHQRPCINVTFRSAAHTHDSRVIGVILTGQLDDGTAGLRDIKRRGGLAVVENPEEAAFPSMPLSALREVDADYTLPLEDIGPKLAELCCEEVDGDRSRQLGKAMEPQLTSITCPDCRGTIWRIPRTHGCEYRCRVGHSYSPKSMLAEHFAAQEKLMWSTIVALEEGAQLANELIDQLPAEQQTALRAEASQRLQQAAQLRKMLEDRKSFPLE